MRGWRGKVCSMSSRLLHLWVLRTSAMRPSNLSTMPVALALKVWFE